MNSRICSNVIVSQWISIFKLFSCIDQSLLGGGNAFLLLYLSRHVLYKIIRVDIEINRISCEGFNGDLHAASSSSCRANCLLTCWLCRISHVSWNVGHWKAETVAHVSDIKLLVAVGSQNCCRIGWQISKLHFHEGLRAGVYSWQGGYDCSLARCNFVLVHLLCLLSLCNSGHKGRLLAICHRKVNCNLTKREVFWDRHHKHDFDWIFAWIFIGLVHDKISKALAKVYAKANLLQGNGLICFLIVQLEVACHCSALSLVSTVLWRIFDEVFWIHLELHDIFFLCLPLKLICSHIFLFIVLNTSLLVLVRLLTSFLTSFCSRTCSVLENTSLHFPLALLPICNLFDL